MLVSDICFSLPEREKQGRNRDADVENGHTHMEGEELGEMNLEVRIVRYTARMCAQPCLTLCDPMDWGLPGSSVQGVFQARIREWVAISSSMGSC